MIYVRNVDEDIYFIWKLIILTTLDYYISILLEKKNLTQ